LGPTIRPEKSQKACWLNCPNILLALSKFLLKLQRNFDLTRFLNQHWQFICDPVSPYQKPEFPSFTMTSVALFLR
jgi:hypothetical protein